MILSSIDRIIFTDINIIRVLGNRKVGAVRDIRISLILRGSDPVDLSVLFCLLSRLFRPLSSDDIIRRSVLHQVHRDHGKLLGSATLQKQHLIVVRNPHQFPQIRLRACDDLLIGLGTVAHLHHGHAGSSVVQHLVCCFLKHFLRQYRRPRRKVIYSAHVSFLLLVRITQSIRNPVLDRYRSSSSNASLIAAPGATIGHTLSSQSI